MNARSARAEKRSSTDTRVVRCDPTSNEWANDIQAMGLHPLPLPSDGHRLDPIRFGPRGDDHARIHDLIIGHLGRGTSDGDQR